MHYAPYDSASYKFSPYNYVTSPDSRTSNTSANSLSEKVQGLEKTLQYSLSVNLFN